MVKYAFICTIDHGLTMVQPWSKMPLSVQLTMVQPWFDHGQICLSGIDHGPTMVQPWFDHGQIMVKPWSK